MTRPRSTLARLRALIAEIPRGKVVTYGQVAAAGGLPGAARVTVWALQRGVGLPWHRVVAAGGRIALEGDAGLEQRLRLEVEGVTFRGDRVRMDLHNWVPRARTIARERRGSWERAEPRPTRRVAGRTSNATRARDDRD
ncbi:MAG: MGMT family protein [Thermoplasmata archaeon]